MGKTASRKRKKFNTAGLCIPQYHYMADVSDKVNLIIKEYIEEEEYFTINRARQYGKTTILYLLQEYTDRSKAGSRRSPRSVKRKGEGASGSGLSLLYDNGIHTQFLEFVQIDRIGFLSGDQYVDLFE